MTIVKLLERFTPMALAEAVHRTSKLKACQRCGNDFNRRKRVVEHMGQLLIVCVPCASVLDAPDTKE